MKKLRTVLLSITLVIALLLSSTLTASAKANQAYSIGGEFHSGADVISAADYWALCGYKSYYNTEPTYAYVSNANNLNSDILYFSSHGSQNSISLPNGIRLTNGTNNSSSNIVGIQSYSLTNTKLVVYDACLTASGDTNLCTQTRSSGADAVIGWRVVIGADDAFKWQTRFQNYCALGYKVHLAMDYADSFSDYNDNSTIKNHLIYGDWLQVIKKTTASAATALNESTIQTTAAEVNRIKDIPELTCDYNSINYKLIEDTISANFDGFNAQNYDKTVTSNSIDNSSFVIDYTLKIGDFSTKSGYTLIFRDGKANAIYDNTIDSTVTVASSVYNVANYRNIENQVELALAEATDTVTAMNDGSKVDNQTWDLYYDVETNSKYIRVQTVYNYQNTGNVGSFTTLYPIS